MRIWFEFVFYTARQNLDYAFVSQGKRFQQLIALSVLFLCADGKYGRKRCPKECLCFDRERNAWISSTVKNVRMRSLTRRCHRMIKCGPL